MRRGIWCVFACLTLSCNTSPDVASTETSPADVESTPPVQTRLEQLARTDPLAYFENCRDRTAREIHSVRGILRMHERLKGKVGTPERIAFCFRDKPYSIRMEWLEGVKLARKTLYVAGENDGSMLVQPAGWRSWQALSAVYPTVRTP